MAGLTSKKVVIRRFDREPVAGFVNPATYLLPDGVEVLTQSGNLVVVPYSEVKVVCFVRDFEAATTPAGQQFFQARPKIEGLWVRMRFLDGELMDGLLSNNLLAPCSNGFTMTPPNPSSNNQKIFVPKSALAECQVVGVIGSPLGRRKRKEAAERQLKMFDE